VMTWRAGGCGALAGALLTLCGVASPSQADEAAVASFLKSLDLVRYAAGTTPPPFSGRTLDAQLSTADVRGKVVLINFWASWCLECRPEMPVLERLHRDLAGRGLAVVGVNAREEMDPVRRYAKELGLSFPLILDSAGKVNAAYGVVGLPTTFVIGRDGRAVAFAVGPREWGGATARALIELLLAEPATRRRAE